MQAIRSLRLADNQRFVFGLSGDGVKAEISLVCMTMSKDLEISIDMVTVR